MRAFPSFSVEYRGWERKEINGRGALRVEVKHREAADMKFLAIQVHKVFIV
jgi:hypothetical protein